MNLVASAVDAVRRTAVAKRLRATIDADWRRTTIAGSPYFDGRWYLTRYGDVRRAGVDPLVHYLAHGEEEGRDPGPEFDADAYMWMNPDAIGQALTHYHRTLDAASLDVGELAPHEIIDVTLPALVDGWLDEAWYITAHARAGADVGRLHPWVHYRRNGLDPSPLFDNHDYHSQLPESERHRVPLEHWLTTGAGPGDDSAAGGSICPQVVSRGAPRQPPYRPLVQHRVRPRSELADLAIAVMVHAYYVDLLPSLLRRLQLLPTTATLLVSVVGADDALLAHAAIDEVLGREQPRVVKVVPNRGRNFAPLLCSFTDELHDHDLVLHLHTKKSLYSGNEQSQWRTHLVTSLLPSAAGVDAILSLLADDPTVGVVQAPTWPGVPHWGNHWLGNTSIGRDLYERLGVDDRTARGYVSYPVGGMFWAKANALVPLLELGLTFGDFDREHGQTDRTMSHAIERTIPAAAAVAGFDTVEFDYSAAQWRRNWSAGNTDDVGSFDLDVLDAALAAADLVSVDLFDTLLLRPTLEPDALFDVLASQLDAGSRRTATGACGAELARFRRAVEHELRVEGSIDGDVDLDEIYAAAIARRPDDSSRLVELKRLELDLERRIAIPRTWLIDHLRADRYRSSATRAAGTPAKRFVLMTDTTQPPLAIEALLHQIGAGDLFDDLYVSNACRARKDTGTMWELVRELEAPTTGRWLHVGDNEFSDIQQAADRSIAWFHVPSPGAIAQLGGVDSSLLADPCRAATQLVAGHGLAALASRTVRGSPQQASVEDFGYGVLGPLTLTFVNWVVHTAREQQIDRLLFTARDGYLAFEVLRRIRVLLPSDVAPADYFHMSRRAALGMLQHDGRHLADICSAGDFAGRVGDLLDARIGFALPGPDGVRLGDAEVRLPDDTDWLIDQLTAFLPAIAEHGRSELGGFRAYLGHLGVADDEHLGLVDLGYSGTTQKVLASVLDQPLSGLYYVTTAAANELGNRAHSCFGRDVTIGGCNLIYDNAKTYELLCAAEHPQVERLAVDARGVRVVFDPRTASTPATYQRVADAQRAAMRFVIDHIERFGPEVLDVPIDPTTVHDALQRCVGTVVPQADDIFGGFVIDDIFCGRGEQDVTEQASMPPARAPQRRPA